MSISQTDLDICVSVLQQVADDPALVAEHDRFKALVAKVHRLGKKHKKYTQRQDRIDADQHVARQAEIVHQYAPSHVPGTSPSSEAKYSRPRKCYVCKVQFEQRHTFYHLLCPSCAEHNESKRGQRADLSGRIALVVGGRIKTGYHTTLKLLRDGARVLLTTRFPQDAARRFHEETDHADWWHRVEFHGLDLRDLPAVDAFAKRLDQELSHLDVLVQNAAQTVKRPLSFYRSLLEHEAEPTPKGALVTRTATPILLEARSGYRGELPGTEACFPEKTFDVYGQQVDLRPSNSWRMRLGEVNTLEMVEVFLVNTIAPLMLSNHLLPVLLRSPHERRFIVHVSSVEGQFAKEDKAAFHPHTNMTKAALNMLTRTVADDLSKQGVYVNCVDPGWFSDERPAPTATTAREAHGFHPPLDPIDGASRIYDPIARGVNESAEPICGAYLKDYVPHPW